MITRARLQVDANPGAWPPFYREALRHPVVLLAHACEPRVVTEPETWLRELGYDPVLTFEPSDDLRTALGLRSLYIQRGKYLRSFRASYWQLVAAHVWAPWLDERGWAPFSERDAIHPHTTVPDDPFWVSPSKGSYQLWRHAMKVEEIAYNGLGVALGREGLNVDTLLTQAMAARRRGADARMRRWIDFVESPARPPELVPEIEDALRRAWPGNVVLPATWSPAEVPA